MSWPWRSPEATRRGLTDRIRSRFPAEELPRRMREVAYRRLLVRLFASRSRAWVVKGGMALLLRLDPNRTSNDIDLAFLGTTGGHSVAADALRADAALDLGDFFSFEVGQGRIDVDGPPTHRAWSNPVVARIGQKEWTTFHVDLLPTPATVATEVLTAPTTLVGDQAVDAIPGLVVLAIAPQIADKVCAIFERHGADMHASSRPRDLADLAMIAEQVEGIDGSRLLSALQLEESRRLGAGSLAAPLPDDLRLDLQQERDWRQRWTTGTRTAPITFDEALEVAGRLVGPALAGAVGGKVWSAVDRGWRSA